MLYLIDSSFYPTLAEIHVLATYIYSSSMKTSCGDSKGRNLALSLGEDAIDVFIWQRFYFWIKEVLQKYNLQSDEHEAAYWSTANFGFRVMWAEPVSVISVFPLSDS